MTQILRQMASEADLSTAEIQDEGDLDLQPKEALYEVRSPVVPLRGEPTAAANIETMLLHGEKFTVYETNNGWCRGRAQGDGYIGYLPEAVLSKNLQDYNRQVTALATHLYATPSIKTEPVATLYMGSLLQIIEEDGDFYRLKDGFYACKMHLNSLDNQVDDFVSIAEQFIGTPYVWGGRTAAGIDCSGLVQIALMRIGISAPRNSGPQEYKLGKKIERSTSLKRGDLVFWPGHVGIMQDKTTLLHANAHHMCVTSETLSHAVKRIQTAENGSNVTAIKRLPKLKKH